MGFSRDSLRPQIAVFAASVAAAVGIGGCGGETTYTATSHTSTATSTQVVGPSKSCVKDVPASRVRKGYQGLLYETKYGSATGVTAVHRCWQRVQVPMRLGKLQESRIALVKAPGSASDPYRPTSSVMRVELMPFDGGGPQGDVTDTGGYRANRAEVLARFAEYGTPDADFPDPVGSTRWYSYSFYLSPTWAYSDDDTHWLDITQWKGLYSGSPAVAVGIKQSKLVLDGEHINVPLSKTTPGRWMALRVGIHFSPDKAQGWITVAVNGHVVLPVTHGATMNTYFHDGSEMTDPSYFKQGIYRSDTWTQTQVIYFGPLKIGTDAASVG